MKVNVLPPSATAMVNHRIHPAQTVKEVSDSPRRLTMYCKSISLRDFRVIGLSLSPKEYSNRRTLNHIIIKQKAFIYLHSIYIFTR